MTPVTAFSPVVFCGSVRRLPSETIEAFAARLIGHIAVAVAPRPGEWAAAVEMPDTRKTRWVIETRRLARLLVAATNGRAVQAKRSQRRAADYPTVLRGSDRCLSVVAESSSRDHEWAAYDVAVGSGLTGLVVGVDPGPGYSRDAGTGFVGVDLGGAP
jgi:hypothetical protein